ncbi:hypothetical protein FCM35_KLT20420 [Carex littledalei]|uniref:Uncharacterized protein n=1 Tax=Carex littledalei TaxID=544730 RepID=A0A833RAB0_9POAL|nr:hypothetical protein FCM35_KLT20420 [Carex littledalei]
MLCCFGCAPKNNRSSGNKNKDEIWGSNEEMLTDLSTLSVKEQAKRLKKAKEEEEIACREAEKVVQWVRRESARFDASTVDDLVSKEGQIK